MHPSAEVTVESSAQTAGDNDLLLGSPRHSRDIPEITQKRFPQLMLDATYEATLLAGV
jgi:hypothetical protein